MLSGHGKEGMVSCLSIRYDRSMVTLKTLRRAVLIGLLIAALPLMVRGFGYSEIKVEYKGQPFSFGRHFTCIRSVAFDMAFFVPNNFRVVTSRLGNIASATLPDGKEIYARLPQSCGSPVSEMSSQDGTSPLPLLFIADFKSDPQELTFYVTASELERGTAELKLISLNTSLKPYPTGFTSPDFTRAWWYLNYHYRNVDADRHWFSGAACSINKLDELTQDPVQLEKARSQPEGLVEDNSVWHLGDDKSPLPENYNFYTQELVGSQNIPAAISSFNPDLALSQPPTYAPIMLALRADSVWTPDFAQRGIVRLYSTPLNGPHQTLDIYGSKLSSEYLTFVYYHKVEDTMMVCRDVNL